MDHADTRDAEAGAWPAQRHVTALYEAHALSLARLALVMLGDPAAAEDVVQDAFLGLTGAGTAWPARRSRWPTCGPAC